MCKQTNKRFHYQREMLNEISNESYLVGERIVETRLIGVKLTQLTRHLFLECDDTIDADEPKHMLKRIKLKMKAKTQTRRLESFHKPENKTCCRPP